MAQQLTSIALKIGGAVLIVSASFFLTLRIMDLGSDQATPDVKGPATPFQDVVNALNAGKAVMVQFDANPAEDHDENGFVVCGPQANQGYLGVFIAGERYEVT